MEKIPGLTADSSDAEFLALYEAGFAAVEPKSSLCKNIKAVVSVLLHGARLVGTWSASSARGRPASCHEAESHAPLSSSQLENIGNFIKAIQAYGMKPHDIFEANDLFENGNMTQVQTTLVALAGLVRTHPSWLVEESPLVLVTIASWWSLGDSDGELSFRNCWLSGKASVGSSVRAFPSRRKPKAFTPPSTLA